MRYVVPRSPVVAHDVVVIHNVKSLGGMCHKLLVSKCQVSKLRFTKEVLWIDSSRVLGQLTSSLDAKHREGEALVGTNPNGNELKALSLSFVASLKACAKKKDLSEGSRLHADIRTSRLLEHDGYIGNALVSMYVKCGELAKAQQCGVLTQAQKTVRDLPVRDATSWSFLIAGYAQQGKNQEALGFFEQMRSEGLFPDASTYACILKACGTMREAYKGKKVHDEIVCQGLLQESVMLGSALVDMYVKCGKLSEAQRSLNELHIRDVVSWSALIAGYVQEGKGKEALKCVHQMHDEGLAPNAITYACILKACGITREINRGKEIHEAIINQRLLESDVVLGNALIDMYVKFGELAKAQEVLLELPVRDVISWSTLIAGYTQQEQGIEALDCFQKMQSEGLFADAVTYACILKACGITREGDRGKKFHDEIVVRGLLEKHIVLGNALVDMYAKCGVLSRAQKVLDELNVRDVVSWSALIAGYVEQGQGEEALGCFRAMQSEGLSPNAVTYACVLKACGITRETDTGMKFHDAIIRQGLLEENVVLGNALIDMYAKCGALTKARSIFDELPVRDVVSWNALIAGYAQEAQGEEALRCFQQMQIEGLSPNLFSWNAVIGGYAQQGLAEEALGIFHQMQHEGASPDAVTFVCVLNACSHAGLVDEGQMYFESMIKGYGILPNKEHQTCMVDLFGRARHLYNAMKIIDQMPSSEYPFVWSALLGACQKWGNPKLGKLAFDHAIQLNGHDAAAYVSMANIYAVSGMQEDVQRIERM